MEDFHKSLTVNDDKSELLLYCIQDHRRLYSYCKKKNHFLISIIKIVLYAIVYVYFYCVLISSTNLYRVP